MCLHLLANHVYLYKIYLTSWEACAHTSSHVCCRATHVHMLTNLSARCSICSCTWCYVETSDRWFTEAKDAERGTERGKRGGKDGLVRFCVCVRERVYMAVMVNQAEKTPHVTHEHTLTFDPHPTPNSSERLSNGGQTLRAEFVCVSTWPYFQLHASICMCAQRKVGEFVNTKKNQLQNWRKFTQPSLQNSRSCSIYKNRRPLLRVCVCFHVCLGTHLSMHTRVCIKINKTRTIEGFLLFGSQARGSYFVVHWSFWSEHWSINTDSATHSCPPSSPHSILQFLPKMKKSCAARKQEQNKHAGSCF